MRAEVAFRQIKGGSKTLARGIDRLLQALAMADLCHDICR